MFATRAFYVLWILLLLEFCGLQLLVLHPELVLLQQLTAAATARAANATTIEEAIGSKTLFVSLACFFFLTYRFSWMNAFPLIESPYLWL